MDKKIFIKGKKYAIPAIFTYPDEKGVFPVVILCHGTAANKNEVGDMYVTLATNLLNEGIASIRMDYAGCGESKAKPQELTFFGEVDDTLKVYEYLQECDFIDKDKIGILGLSQGVRIWVELVKRVPEIKFGVSWSGACQRNEGIFENWYQGYYEEAVKNGYASILMTWGDKLILSKEWFDDIKKSTPLDGIKGYKGPVLAVAGVDDDMVPCEHTFEIIKMCSNPKSKAIFYPKANHIFNVLEEDKSVTMKIIKETVEWIKKNV
jgi:dienelactone hydrolase